MTACLGPVPRFQRLARLWREADMLSPTPVDEMELVVQHFLLGVRQRTARESLVEHGDGLGMVQLIFLARYRAKPRRRRRSSIRLGLFHHRTRCHSSPT